MKSATLGDITLHYCEDGAPDGQPVVFANSLGTDFRLWDKVVARLPQTLRIIRFDKRGHGLSTMPPAPYTMGALVTDAERLLDHLNIRDCVFVGLSIGGMIAQGLAVKRLDQIGALVLSNTGAKIATRDMWDARIAAVEGDGIEAIADATMERWFPEPFRSSAEAGLWRAMMTRQPKAGYMGCAAAIAGTDFMTTTSSLRLPTLGIAGSEDKSTPPDLVKETVDLIPGSQFKLIRGVGHLPCVDAPDEYTETLVAFLRSLGRL